MNVLLVGSGGREHALAWKLSQSPRLNHLYVAPGNAGTSRQVKPSVPGIQIENIPISDADKSSLVSFASEKMVELVIIGPEAPLDAGLADDLREAGLRVFGPSKAAAQIEASKAFAKALMNRHAIPTARYAAFDNLEAATSHIHSVDYQFVIKVSGLAAGKGVMIPHDREEAERMLRQIFIQRTFGAAGDQVLIEERLAGEEVSLLAFTDGRTVQPMPPVQDHKRLLAGDRGPNTGGMGTYAPTPICSAAQVKELTSSMLQPAVDGLYAEGRPFIGVLYAGLILTAAGPRVLEFNCRFGDPETQVLLPLLSSDLLDILEACVEGSLAEKDICWSAESAACVVMASEGYPGSYPKGREIKGLDSGDLPSNAVIFHAGTAFDPLDGKTITAGGRVLSVTAWGAKLSEALETAYAACKCISFEGMQYRPDIGTRAMNLGD